jgi:Uma2 family endonuclease
MLYAEYGRSLLIRPADGEDTDLFFDKICEQYDNKKIEQDFQGNVYVLAPGGGESSYQNAEITAQLRMWSNQDGRGRTFDASALFILPDGSKRSPDGSWVSKEKLRTLSQANRRKFLKLVPEFVIELKSPTDKLPELKRKMEEWMRHGVQLGWLIDPAKRQVFVYSKGVPEVAVLADVAIIVAGEPVNGFLLDLEPIWSGLADL